MAKAMMQNAPRLTDNEVIYLNRIVHGLSASPYFTVSDQIRAVGKRLQEVSPEYRLNTLQQAIGTESARVLSMNPPVSIPTGSEPQLALVQPSQPTRQNLHYADDLRHLPQLHYQLFEYPIYAQGFNVLFGNSGAGKSFVGIDISGRVSIAGGVVIYIAAEGLFGYSSRWECWKHHHGISSCKKLLFWDSPLSLPNPVDADSFMTQIAPFKPNLIIIDTVARCMAGYDENSTKDMSEFIAACDRMRQQLSVGILAIHHTGKDGRIRGSSVLFASADSVLFLKRDDTEIKLVNEADGGGKNKYSPEAPPRALTLMPVSVTVDGMAFDSAVLVDSHKQFVKEQQKLKHKHNQILEVIEGYQSGLNIKQIQDATGIANSSIYRLVRDLKEGDYVVDSSGGIAITDKGREVLLSDRT